MLFKISRVLTMFGILAAAGSANTAFGQFGWCNPCCCCPPPIRVQPCYQTVPVTELRECRQIVQKPVVETKYVEQPCTEYRQVVETKTAEVPTVAWQNVTELHTVQRDCGHWQTQYHCRPKMHPCQYDGRPDLMGWLSRTEYSLRMAFTPDHYAERSYVPNVVTQQVPVTRQVAVRGSQTINYQVAKVVPIHTTRKVAVNTVRMVSEEIVTRRPVTVMKVVPFGSTYAFDQSIGGTATARRPAPDAYSDARAVLPRANPPGGVAKKTNEAVRELKNQPESVEEDVDEDRIQRKDRQLNQVEPAKAEVKEEIAGVWRARQPVGRWVARTKRPASGPAFPDMTIASNVTK